jgi:hypothetical protein
MIIMFVTDIKQKKYHVKYKSKKKMKINMKVKNTIRLSSIILIKK